jgi:predicted kinase
MSVISALPREAAIARILQLTTRPESKSDRPWLVMAVGLPGSGKSTFSRKLARGSGATLLESDALRKALFVEPTYESEESARLFDALYGAAKELLQTGASVIVDATNLRERDRQRGYEVSAEMGCEILVLHFRAPEAVIAQRLTGRTLHMDPEDNSAAGIAVYQRMAQTEEPLTREHWDIDTADSAATNIALQHAIDILKPHHDPA